MSRVLGVIPARYASTRFPGKPLVSLGQRSMLEEVWARARGASRIERLVVATEDRRIVEAARAFGAEVLLTSDRHASGTDRVAEVAERLGGPYDVVINIQGDEPLLSPASLDRLAQALDAASGGIAIATLYEPIEAIDELFDPNVVKVVAAADGRALYFSRSPIPYYRDAQGGTEGFRDRLPRRAGGLAGYRKHQGLYAFRRRTLLELARLAPSANERDEGLEQLRWLDAGYAIQLVPSDHRSLAVDAPADVERVKRRLYATIDRGEAR
jgi:3-deoxy-manno-octulosonate cytidylyltransferase (CMP-KDO synthetase)